MTAIDRRRSTSNSTAGGRVVRVPADRLGVGVVRELVTGIVTGEAPTGSALPAESFLSQRFGVSRTVVRESVKRVEEKGLLTVAQGRGTTVNPPSEWNVLDPVVLSALITNDGTVGVLDDLATVRGSLEAAMAAAAAGRRTPARTVELRHAYERMFASIEDADAYNQADMEFHLVVMAQSGNRLAANITGSLFQRARDSHRFAPKPTREWLDLTLVEHRAIMEAIEQGGPQAAAAAMATHINDSWTRRRPQR